jgi:signal transduction histidine kinase/AraC-like DNA-binding protein
MKMWLLVFVVFFFVPFACLEEGKVEKYVIGFSQCTGADAWRKTMHDEMLRELAFHPDLNLIIEDAKGDNDLQVSQIRGLIERDVDLLIVSPNEAEPITPVVEEAFTKGIPVIVIDRKTTSDLYTAYVGADNYEIGETAGEYVADLLKRKGKIIEIWGLRGSTPAIDRHRGFKAVIGMYPELEVVAEVTGDWRKEVAEVNLPGILRSHPDVDLIYAHNDVMALGAYEIARKMGLADSLLVIGVDGLAGPNGGIQFVESGILDATFLYPTGGEEAIRIADLILKKKPFERYNSLSTTVIDSRNVRIMKLQANKLLSQQQSIERQQEKIGEQVKLYRNQRIVLYVIIISLVGSVILGAFFYNSLVEKQEANRTLSARNQEISEQRNEIKKMADEAEEAHQAKFRFFTNVSHEFRTPLTLILGPVEELLQSAQAQKDPRIHQQLSLIRKNGIRLLRLVNQLMDFRKIENNKMRVRASENDIVAFVKEIMLAYELVARSRNIRFELQTGETSLPVWFDPNMMDKVLFNLLSNAFKFTGDGGQITMGVLKHEAKNSVLIYLEDNGRGMSREHVEHAFDRFYQGDEYSTLRTGLGLSLSKELIQLHHGEIGVQSEKGKGTRFEIMLPLGNSHFYPMDLDHSPREKINYDEYRIYVDEVLPPQVPVSKPEETGSGEQTLLIIEDNTDLQAFLAGELGSHYELEMALTGSEGLKKAFEHIPDLIICDLSLPGKDGLAVTRELKADMRTSHIPIIVLTAQHTIEKHIEGIRHGADAYLPKPFHMELLKELIRSQLQNRKMLLERFGDGFDPKKLFAHVSAVDQEFIRQFTGIVEAGYSDPGFTVQDICKSLGLSRAQLYRKVKALLGMGVSDFLQDVRLRKAAQLLMNPELNISEIAYMVGYSTVSAFSVAFKSYFHVNPSQYRQEHFPGE